MNLYYTIKSAPEDIQTKPNLSLGGYKSANRIQNSTVGALFGDISMYTVKNGNQNQYIGLILKNETDKKLDNTKIWTISNEGCYSTLKFAIVSLSQDSEGNPMMEHIPSLNSKPLFADFYQIEELMNAGSFGQLQVDEMVGIWIERSLLIDTIKTDQNSIYKQTSDPYKYEAVELSKEDSIEIHISYDEVI